MSLKRLQARCTTAQFVTTDYVEGYTLQFNKKRIDGSGKKNLIPVQDAQEKPGVWCLKFPKRRWIRLRGKGNDYVERNETFIKI